MCLLLSGRCCISPSLVYVLGQEMKKELESRLEEVLAKLEQSQRIPASQHQVSMQTLDGAEQTVRAASHIYLKKVNKPNPEFV